ncbi:sigma-70 family RNA polymerase sigma factor [Paenibacillus sp. 32352]|uniref:sigma-70 family RNA polymerase sigma factor n=1 Tax=Paenibacillus sp. 32352 TaxID=1969111 RepID=UPI0009ADF869|nr:sigma-70 family RNA polymerase sigma factor [Paenibacillus sp. 32352]
METQEWLAEQFEAHRSHLQAVAYRMLGSLSEADDAVQESWFRLSRSDTSGIGNIGGWLTTVVSRVCLDMLRSRKSRREEPLATYASEPGSSRGDGSDPEQEALLADSVGLAMLVVLGSLNPAERIAFVLHDVFALPFEEIAPIVGRSKEAARQLASRARRRVQGTGTDQRPDLAHQRELVDAFLAATRAGNFEALLKVLDPNVVLQDDRGVDSAARVIRGVQAVSGQVVAGGARAAHPMLIDGAVGIVVAPRGELLFVIKVAIADGKITGFHIISDKEQIGQMDLAVLSAGD